MRRCSFHVRSGFMSKSWEEPHDSSQLGKRKGAFWEGRYHATANE